MVIGNYAFIDICVDRKTIHLEQADRQNVRSDLRGVNQKPSSNPERFKPITFFFVFRTYFHIKRIDLMPKAQNQARIYYLFIILVSYSCFLFSNVC